MPAAIGFQQKRCQLQLHGKKVSWGRILRAKLQERENADGAMPSCCARPGIRRGRTRQWESGLVMVDRGVDGDAPGREMSR